MYKFVMFAGLGLASLVGLHGVCKADESSKAQAASAQQVRAKYRVGDSVWILKEKKWYPGTVLQVGYIGTPRKATYLVHYIGYDWDNWVFENRLSPR